MLLYAAPQAKARKKMKELVALSRKTDQHVAISKKRSDKFFIILLNTSVVAECISKVRLPESMIYTG